MHFIDYFERSAALWPDRPCLHDSHDTMLTYREVRDRVRRTLHALRAVGMPPEAGIGILSPNDINAYICVLAAERSGFPRLQINLRDGAGLIAQVMRFNEARIVIYHSSMAELVGALKPLLPDVMLWVALDQPSGDDPLWADWIAPHPATVSDAVLRPDDIAARSSTGGTTGMPKTVLHSRNLLQQVALNTTYMAFPHDGPVVHLAVAPVTHAAGQLCHPAILTGGLNILMPVLDFGRVAECIERFRVTMMFMPPTAIYTLLQQPNLRKHDLSSLKYFVYAAAPMSVQKLRDAMDVFGPVMAQFYAQTEAGLPVTYLSPKDHQVIGTPHEHRLGSCGRPGPFSDVAIMDDNGNLLPDGERGEIVCRGDQVASGYYKNEAAWAELSAHGWHHTGDIGYRDADGFYYVVDRKKDMIISGGFNVFPTEVEQAVSAHPAVLDCSVVGAPDDKWGEAVTAVVQLKPGQTASAEDIIAHCRARLGPIQTPKRVEFWPDLPRSPVGKVLKKDIRARFWSGRDRAV
jgi:acyl-CoA synthetase (AMP-forming)/AMP-acid ligase II